jgi:hypothetical protein
MIFIAPQIRLDLGKHGENFMPKFYLFWTGVTLDYSSEGKHLSLGLIND